ncbi:signal peptidase I [bacterium]|nr:signal peptidase I [bacterium]NBX50512.1 signal peptidase I [bacterium]
MTESSNQSQLQALGRFFLEMLQIAAIAIAIILPVRYFLVQPFIVKGASMEPSYYENEYLIIDELTYRFRDPLRGETVVFHPPGNESQYYIKRVIGLPGETVEIRDGHIIIYNDEYLNGITLDESYLSEETEGKQRVQLGQNEYFLMGDNRDASLDSRAIGPIPFENITGKVWIRGLPLDHAGILEIPTYNL